MRTLDDDISLCIDCTLLAETGEVPDNPKTARSCVAGLEALTEKGEQTLVSWTSEDDDGSDEFSRRACDCCGSHLAGHRQRFTLLTSAPMPATEAAELAADLKVANTALRAAEEEVENQAELIAELRETIAELRPLAAEHEHPDIRARWILERAADLIIEEQPAC